MHLYLVLCFSSFSTLYGQTSTADRLVSGSVRVKVALVARTSEVTPFSVAAQKTPPVATSEKDYPPELSGTVVDTSGALIPGATVQVRSPNGNVQRTTASDRDGSFTISGLSAGTYQLVVSSRGFETKEILVTIKATDTPAPLRISLSVASESTFISVQGRADSLIGLAESASQGTVCYLNFSTGCPT